LTNYLATNSRIILRAFVAIFLQFYFGILG